jgi:hypothetical protein
MNGPPQDEIHTDDLDKVEGRGQEDRERERDSQEVSKTMEGYHKSNPPLWEGK